ncbi:S8 family serine peptidase [Streptomyces sp. NPDC048718]|uniref:S8 family serine peptidase n=1 Tax=Streptomyces sp. NPDC048718 TaxID=3365587 RepID=UPI003711DC66
MIEGRRLRRGFLGTMAATAVLTAGFIGTAPVAVAADIQSQQWYLDAMHAEEIWKTSTGEGIKIAVIDSGVNSSTPTLRGQILKGMDNSEAKGDETDDYDGHGTTIAELIVGTGSGGGLKGLAPGAKVVPYRIAYTELQNKEKTNAFDVKEAIKAAADSDAQIINASFGNSYYSTDEREAIKYAQSKGKLFFASAGNDAKKGNSQDSYPAAYPEAIAVASTDRNGKVSGYSQHGKFVDLAAPGSDIPGWCDAKFTQYCGGDGGTSAASAIASASAALIWSAHPDWTGNQVLRVMFESAARGDDWEPGSVSTYLGYGIVRPNAAITRGIGKPGDPDVSPLTNTKVGGKSAGSGASGTSDADGSSTAPGSSTASAKPSAPGSSQAPSADSSAAPALAGSGGSADEGTPWGLVIGGAAAVVVVGAGAAFVVARRRRTA